MMARFIRDLILMPLPFAALSVFFFLGHVPKQGVFLALITLAVLWYIRPRRKAPTELDADDDLGNSPRGVPGVGVGKLGGPV